MPRSCRCTLYPSKFVKKCSRQNEVQILSFKALKNRPYTLVHVSLIAPCPPPTPSSSFLQCIIIGHHCQLSAVIWITVKQPGLPSRHVLFEVDWVKGTLNKPPPPYGKLKKTFSKKKFTRIYFEHTDSSSLVRLKLDNSFKDL